MDHLIAPSFLHSGDLVALVATARKVSPEEMEQPIKMLQSAGFEVLLPSHLYAQEHQFAGTDEQRKEDLQFLLDHPKVKAIFCVRGGYGTPRIVDALDFTLFQKFPKWVIGFSDLTVLLNFIFAKGYQSIHATMPILFAHEKGYSSFESLIALLTEHSSESPIEVINTLQIRTGKCSGLLLGGNLSLVQNMIGTSNEPDYRGNILFLEDLDEYAYHIDRMLLHLSRSNVFSKISGLILGYFSDLKDNKIPFGSDVYEMVKYHTRNYDFPIACGFPIGHEFPNMPVVLGKGMTLEVRDSSVCLQSTYF